MRHVLLTACAALAFIAVAPPAAVRAETNVGAAAIEASEGREVATKLADMLVRSFVIRQQAERYAAMLRANAASGRYDQGTRGEVAKRITDDLQAVAPDGHLRVNVIDPAEVGRRGPPRKWPPLIQSAKTIAPGVGYIRFTAFFGTPEEMAGVKQWLADNRDAHTLIFDLRNHHGGGLDEQDLIFAQIFGEKTPLVKMAMAKALYDERGSPLEGSSTLIYAPEGDRMVGTHFAIPGPDNPLRKAKVYALTSSRSASAAEHFALALKSSGRGTLIGEATAGANHFGGPERISEHFDVWLPIGRTYDIKTGEDWEGDGIAPDVAVDPADALVVALEKAGVPRTKAIELSAAEKPAEPITRERKPAS